jgi:hypothetical protein
VVSSVGERRNHRFKNESDCLRTGISIKYESWKVLREILPYEFFVIHAAIQPRNSFPEQVFNPAVSSYENCKRPRRNHTSKRENCFAIFILVCNFHISLQFSYQFAILTFWCMVPTWTFAIFIWVCNFHMSLQFSYQFAILTSNCRTSYVHGFIRIPM